MPAGEVSSWCSKVPVSPERSGTKPAFGFAGLEEGDHLAVRVVRVRLPRAAWLVHPCRQATTGNTISLSWESPSAQNLPLPLALCSAHRCLRSDLSSCLPVIPLQPGSADAAFHASPGKSARQGPAAGCSRSPFVGAQVRGRFVMHKHRGLEAPRSPHADSHGYPVSPTRSGNRAPGWSDRLLPQGHSPTSVDVWTPRFRRSLSINVKCIPEACGSYPKGMDTLSRFGLIATWEDWNIRCPVGGAHGAAPLFSSICSMMTAHM